MPSGFKTLTGPNPEFAVRFGLREHPSEDYPPRTELNVRISDGTLWFGAKTMSLGEKCTFKFVRLHEKPSLSIDMQNPRPVEEVVEWIRREGIKTLNIAGDAEPKSRKALAHGITAFTVEYLERVFEALGHSPPEQSPDPSRQSLLGTLHRPDWRGSAGGSRRPETAAESEPKEQVRHCTPWPGSSAGPPKHVGS